MFNNTNIELSQYRQIAQTRQHVIFQCRKSKQWRNKSSRGHFNFAGLAAMAKITQMSKSIIWVPSDPHIYPNKSYKHECKTPNMHESREVCPACKKRAQGHSRWSRQSLLIRGRVKSSPPFYPTKPPSVLWVWGGKEQNGEEGKGHLQLNKTAGWKEEKMKAEKTKREGRGEEEMSKERIIWGC